MSVFKQAVTPLCPQLTQLTAAIATSSADRMFRHPGPGPAQTCAEHRRVRARSWTFTSSHLLQCTRGEKQEYRDEGLSLWQVVQALVGPSDCGVSGLSKVFISDVKLRGNAPRETELNKMTSRHQRSIFLLHLAKTERGMSPPWRWRSLWQIEGETICC